MIGGKAWWAMVNGKNHGVLRGDLGDTKKQVVYGLR